MTSTSYTVLQKPENENDSKKMLCPLHGCKRVYTETSALQSHIKNHKIPAQSLPGKVLLCSSTGCSSSFPNMQKLMEHMRQHHKPNIYFQCESCRTKLRSYRGLLAHLHTCSKVPRSKSKAAEPTAPTAGAAGGPSTSPQVAEQQPPRLESMSSPQQVSDQVTNPDGSLPAAAPQLGPTEPPALGPPMLPLQETPVSQLSEATPQPAVKMEAPDLPCSLKGSDPPNVQSQQQPPSRSAVGAHPGPGTAALSPPGSSAVWKKNQGLSCSRRVLWEHTRGRYTCVQCGHTTTNRKAMTQHINGQHSGTKAAEDTGSSAANT
ncbi:zinc finger protein 414 [Kryptolebias marmoratus]|uniref:Zinc finger protein 414 n=1 Tax=Kryptolebias marmoratus TaxID=37003 RepID=A0A3Q3AKH0_KRYMA|nr:zinc finger protein 414 [Kryptolebias marmoratus]